jgi:hypothetical protein
MTHDGQGRLRKPAWFPGDSMVCAKGHIIHIEDKNAAKGKILPCGCPATSAQGRQAEGLPPLRTKGI